MAAALAADVSFPAAGPLVVTGRALGCCDARAAGQGQVLRFGALRGALSIDGVRWSAAGLREGP